MSGEEMFHGFIAILCSAVEYSKSKRLITRGEASECIDTLHDYRKQWMMELCLQEKSKSVHHTCYHTTM
jgi:hypothetical protein